MTLLGSVSSIAIEHRANTAIRKALQVGAGANYACEVNVKGASTREAVVGDNVFVPPAVSVVGGCVQT